MLLYMITLCDRKIGDLGFSLFERCLYALQDVREEMRLGSIIALFLTFLAYAKTKGMTEGP